MDYTLLNSRRPPALLYKPCFTISSSGLRTDPSSGLNNLSFSPDGRYLAASFERDVVLWELMDSELLRAPAESWKRKLPLSLDPRDAASITSMSWASSNHLVIGSSTGWLYIASIDVKESRLRSFPVSDLAVKIVVIDSNYRIMAILAGSNEIGIWSYCENENRWRGLFFLNSPETYISLGEDVVVTSICWDESDEGQTIRLVVSYLHHGIITWSIDPPEMTSMVNVEKAFSGSLARDGHMFAIPNAKGTFDIYDLSLKNKVMTLCDPESESPSADTVERPARFTGDGSWMVGVGGRSINVWDLFANIRVQKLVLGGRVSVEKGILLAVSETTSEQDRVTTFRIAAAGKDDGYHIQIWKTAVQGPTTEVLLGNGNSGVAYWLIAFVVLLLSFTALAIFQ